MSLSKLKITRYTLFILLLSSFLFGCQQNGFHEDITKKWTFKNDTNKFIVFNNTNNSLTFSTNKNGNEKGSCTISDHTIQLTYIPNATTDADSLVYNTEEGIPQITYFKNNDTLAVLTNGALSGKEITQKYLYNISGRTLILKNSVETLQLETPQIKTSSISFISILRGLLGLLVLLFIACLFSQNRKAISWPLVGKGLFVQLILAIGVLKVPMVEKVFEWVGSLFIKIISFTQEGTDFLFHSFASGEIESPLLNFVVMVLPTIIFFAALTSLLYYWGILQKIVYGMAWLMKQFMKLSGAESLVAASNIFLGQTESPLLVRPYLMGMTKSELMLMMTAGMATIAGGVLAAYIGFLGGGDPVQELFFAKHLLAASVMSAPAAVVAAKILVPETEEVKTDMSISKDKIGSNALEAIANGTTEGLKLAVNVGAMLLVFIALIAMGNAILHWAGDVAGLTQLITENTNFDGLSFQFIIGYAFAPIAWTMGVCSQDMVLVGQLLGEKTILNEFYAYVTLGTMKTSGMFAEEKSIIMATYILCGFANFASIGIQIGGIGALVPSRKAVLSKLGVRALIGGTLASLFTAVMVGMLL